MTGPSARFDAIVFDVGGVLTTSPARLMANRAIESGIDIRDFAGIVLGPLDEDTDHPWHRAERGEIGLPEVSSLLRDLAKTAGISGEFPAPPTGEEVRASLAPAPEMVALAFEAMERGLRVGVLTNNIVEWGAWRSIVPVDQFAHVVVDSCEVGLRKPDPKIYQLALDLLGVTASRTLFLDDFAWNVSGAVQVGMTGVHVSDHARAVGEARSLLGWEASGQ
jgi:putative hydrolase of the HAD superfamily